MVHALPSTQRPTSSLVQYTGLLLVFIEIVIQLCLNRPQTRSQGGWESKLPKFLKNILNLRKSKKLHKSNMKYINDYVAHSIAMGVGRRGP